MERWNKGAKVFFRCKKSCSYKNSELFCSLLFCKTSNKQTKKKTRKTRDGVLAISLGLDI